MCTGAYRWYVGLVEKDHVTLAGGIASGISGAPAIEDGAAASATPTHSRRVPCAPHPTRSTYRKAHLVSAVSEVAGVDDLEVGACDPVEQMEIRVIPAGIGSALNVPGAAIVGDD